MGSKFKVGDKIVYPNQGVGIVEEICKTDAFSEAEESCVFYRLRILGSDTTVLVPIEKSDILGLRSVISKDKVSKLLTMLRKNAAKSSRNWKGRFKENSEKMQTGKIEDVAEVFRNLHHLNLEKPLSYREKRMMERAREMIISEVAEAEKLSEIAASERVDKAITYKSRSARS
jgi:CarD family transcriptional regulator